MEPPLNHEPNVQNAPAPGEVVYVNPSAQSESAVKHRVKSMLKIVLILVGSALVLVVLFAVILIGSVIKGLSDENPDNAKAAANALASIYIDGQKAQNLSSSAANGGISDAEASSTSSADYYVQDNVASAHASVIQAIDAEGQVVEPVPTITSNAGLPFTVSSIESDIGGGVIRGNYQITYYLAKPVVCQSGTSNLLCNGLYLDDTSLISGNTNDPAQTYSSQPDDTMQELIDAGLGGISVSKVHIEYSVED
jgi:hypothetical protein